jgi:hypothetical protein
MFKRDEKIVKDMQPMVDTPAFLTIEGEYSVVYSINLNGVESFYIKNDVLHVCYLSGGDTAIAVSDDEADRIKYRLKQIGSMIGVVKSR